MKVYCDMEAYDYIKDDLAGYPFPNYFLVFTWVTGCQA